jgi:hypothetical protein
MLKRENVFYVKRVKRFSGLSFTGKREKHVFHWFRCLITWYSKRNHHRQRTCQSIHFSRKKVLCIISIEFVLKTLGGDPSRKDNAPPPLPQCPQQFWCVELFSGDIA